MLTRRRWRRRGSTTTIRCSPSSTPRSSRIRRTRAARAWCWIGPRFIPRAAGRWPIAAAWEAPGIPTVERYRYLYDRDELAAWLLPVTTAARAAREVHVLLNNCHGNYGTTNAVEIGRMLGEA